MAQQDKASGRLEAQIELPPLPDPDQYTWYSRHMVESIRRLAVVYDRHRHEDVVRNAILSIPNGYFNPDRRGQADNRAAVSDLVARHLTDAPAQAAGPAKDVNWNAELSEWTDDDFIRIFHERPDLADRLRKILEECPRSENPGDAPDAPDGQIRIARYGVC